MGWEKRQRGGEYYYRVARVDGKPRRIYLGSGEAGRVHELLDRRERRQREAKLAARREAARRLDECDRLWQETWAIVRTLAHAALVLAGWYSHHGQWRKAVGKPRSRKSKAPPPAAPPGPASPAEAAELRARLAALTDRANAGDDVALAELRAFLDDHPEVWRTMGDLTRLSVLAWTSLIAGGNVLQREAIARFVADWKAQLGGPHPTPPEQALIDTAAVARLSLAHAECLAAAASGSLDLVESRVKRLDAAVRRLNATLKLLVQVRAAHPQGLVPSSPPAGAAPHENTAGTSTPADGFPRLHRPPSHGRRVG